MQSRQEFQPIIGKLDYAYAEPLHNANNIVQQLHSYLWEEAVLKSEPLTTVTRISALPDKLPLKKFLLVHKGKCKATRLYKKIVSWLKEGRKKKFEYQFTGEETKAFCNTFMFLVDALYMDTDCPSEKLKLYAIGFAGLHLSNSILLMNSYICKSRHFSF